MPRPLQQVSLSERDSLISGVSESEYIISNINALPLMFSNGKKFIFLFSGLQTLYAQSGQRQ